MQLKESVILVTSLGIGHLNPTIELAKLFVSEGISVTVVIIDLPFGIFTDSFMSRVSTEYPSISFHRLPKITPSPSCKTHLSTIFETLRLSNPHLLDFLKESRLTCNVRALVLDMFCTAALDVADELGLPSYFFFTSSATALVAYLSLPTYQSQLVGNDMVRLPGLPPIPASDLDLPNNDSGEADGSMFFHFKRIPEAKGIMINTFEWLEKRAVEALVNGDCVLDRKMPPVYCIGPLIAASDRNKEEGLRRHECLTWLDAQQEKSVVFICFGSWCSFPTEQMKEIAIGLERSGQRFLWVVKPSSEFLEGFLERTRERGMVLDSWVPQVEVLGHKSVGGFVSHSGWNSTLEAVSEGVSIVSWPMHEEQRFNKALLVEEAKLAVGMEGYRKTLVSAEEIEMTIRGLIESEERKKMRERTLEAKEMAMVAQREGGSSNLAWLELVTVMRKN